MSLFTKLYEAVHSWRRRRGGPKARKRADLAMEQLDHRQLLAVNFTGNAPIDFPATESPGVVVIPSPADNTTPKIPSVDAGGNPIAGTLATVINKSGFEIDQLRVTYDSSDDTLNVGVEGPPSGRGGEVIAGDSDNNGNSATVNPNVTAIEPGFMDPADMGATKTYGIFLNLTNPTNPTTTDVVAGFPLGGEFDTGPKPFEVARPIPAAPTVPPSVPLFDPNNLLPQYTGNYYLANDPNHPNFELEITHFSQLYQQITGNTLTPETQIAIGAFGSSDQDGGISDEYFPPQAITLGAATPAPPVTPAIAVSKLTNGISAPSAPGPTLTVGDSVTWTYDVTNPGTEPLKDVSIIDDAGTPGNTADDIHPTFVSGDTNGNGLLDPGEDWKYTATGTVVAGQYQNTATVAGAGNTDNAPVVAITQSHYNGQAAMVCPPMSPTIYINPHENNHVNTAHPTAIRVNVLGSSGFNPTTIIPSTVRFGDAATIQTTGATPIANFERNVNDDQFPDETFVFNGLQVNLPPGETEATITGSTTSGQTFSSTVEVFNRDYSYYTQAQINNQQARFAAYDKKNNISTANGVVAPPPVIPKAAQQLAASMAINDLYDPFKGEKVPRQVSAGTIGTATPASDTASAASAPVVSIKTKNGKVTKAKAVSVNLAGQAAKSPSIAQLLAGGA